VRELKGGYATSDTVDDAIRFISEAEAPWFGWVAFNAIHVPLHAPPTHLHTVDVDGELGSGRRRARAMVQAVDTEIGRLLSSMSEEERARTIVVFLSDNGSGKGARAQRGRSSKGSVFEAGLNVPLIVSGSVVAEAARGSESDALVHVLDLFAAAAEWSGAMLPEHSEAVSLHPYLRAPNRDSLRPVVFTELFASNGSPPVVAGHDRAVRDARYKLVDRSGTRSFFDLQADPTERYDLLAAPPVGHVARRLRRLETALELRGDPGLLAELPPSS
jgi:arylsulfatase A-like enzyme